MDKNPRESYFFILVGVALAAACAWIWHSAFRWAHFSYTTFDLAFYVQALDGFSHGRNWSSLLGCKPFGNHADFIILLVWPLYAALQHPLVPVVIQNLALAACLPLGFVIARQLGWSRQASFWLALVLLANPVLTFVALHEFHPEAFAAPLWLALYLCWQQRRPGAFWCVLLLFLSCKENLGLMVCAWCFAKALDRSDTRAFWPWKGAPTLVAAGWMALYLCWLGPRWNAGNIDFAILYAPLREQGIFRGGLEALQSSLRGNLLWALLLPLLLLPLRKPWTLLPALPILLQHLLSSRPSEWTVYFHYAAPLLPVFWIATVEALSSFRTSARLASALRFAPYLLVGSNILCSLWLEAPQKYLAPFFADQPQLQLKREIVASIPKNASVVAPLGWQTHLAAREELFSLHLILKGLKTLSRERYKMPFSPDYAIVDYDDLATFDSASGYYHPAMRTSRGEIVPSSDILLHQLLASAAWEIHSTGSITVFRKVAAPAELLTPIPAALHRAVVDPGTDLISISAAEPAGRWQISSRWIFRREREKIPWMHLIARNRRTGEHRVLTRGLCVPEGVADGRIWPDEWTVIDPPAGGGGEWELSAVYEDFATTSYSREQGPLISVPIAWSK